MNIKTTHIWTRNCNPKLDVQGIPSNLWLLGRRALLELGQMRQKGSEVPLSANGIPMINP